MQLRLAIAVALAAESETILYWAQTGGTAPLADLLAASLATIEPALLIRVPGQEAPELRAEPDPKPAA